MRTDVAHDSLTRRTKRFDVGVVGEEVSNVDGHYDVNRKFMKRRSIYMMSLATVAVALVLRECEKRAPRVAAINGVIYCENPSRGIGIGVGTNTVTNEHNYFLSLHWDAEWNVQSQKLRIEPSTEATPLGHILVGTVMTKSSPLYYFGKTSSMEMVSRLHGVRDPKRDLPGLKAYSDWANELYIPNANNGDPFIQCIGISWNTNSGDASCYAQWSFEKHYGADIGFHMENLTHFEAMRREVENLITQDLCKGGEGR
ncbi:hypothetical protein [Nguyenibacter sp. L1]|uniref:hypothetical protein n=1 Tax=Nguyenibacter sp. L1 TaxID=3049350 RepID=UPI002B4AA2DD|nr:hypothetical protein [Nguyenibacter sp. L1]WRH89632.1 hypothetical protein QN315_08585 [Nguyenibacter sp. L1]